MAVKGLSTDPQTQMRMQITGLRYLMGNIRTISCQIIPFQMGEMCMINVEHQSVVDRVMKRKWIDAYLQTASVFSELSSAERLKVGAVIVKDHRIISIGYNGTPAGWDNSCENKEYMKPNDDKWRVPGEIEKIYPFKDENGRYRLKTKNEVLHAEENAIVKLASCNESGQGASMFVTHAPCIQCAKLIYGAGIKSMWFSNYYRTTEGIDFLRKSRVSCEKI